MRCQKEASAATTSATKQIQQKAQLSLDWAERTTAYIRRPASDFRSRK